MTQTLGTSMSHADEPPDGPSLVRYARPELERITPLILSERSTGATLGELSRRHGISVWAVRQVLSAAGLTGRVPAGRPLAPCVTPVSPPALRSIPTGDAAEPRRSTRRLGSAQARELRRARTLAVRNQRDPTRPGADQLAQLITGHRSCGVALEDLAAALGLSVQATQKLLS